MTTTVGVISDTHGLLRPQACDALAGCDLIVHAGDIGTPAVLTELARIAPVHPIRGNVDRGPWAAALPETDIVTVEDVHIYVLHDLAALDLDPVAAGLKVIVSGHSHRPSTAWRDGVLYFNPGSAGPRRFTLPIAMGKLHVAGDTVEPQTIALHA